jgi:P4 family phage/plasmid primase-like protien
MEPIEGTRFETLRQKANPGFAPVRKSLPNAEDCFSLAFFAFFLHFYGLAANQEEKRRRNKMDQQKQVYHALGKYQSMGLPVIPCQGKIPCLKGWSKRGVPNEKEIKQWIKDFPNLGIGLVLGSQAGLIGIDIDGMLAWKKLMEISQGDLPDTWMYETPGGGMRLLYSVPENVSLKKHTIPLPGEHSELALLGEGQQTILPPSVHPNGGVYQWCKGHTPDDREVAKATKWMMDLMSPRGAESQGSGEPTSVPESEKVLQTLASQCARFREDWDEQQADGLSEDRWFLWSASLTSAGHAAAAEAFSKSSFKHNDRSEERLEDLKKTKANGLVRCTTFGCSEDQIRRCFSQTKTNEHGEITNSPGAVIRRVQKDKKRRSSSWTKQQLEAIGFLFQKDASTPFGINGNMFASHILNHFDLLFLGPAERFYHYEDGVWRYNDPNALGRKLRDFLHQYVPNLWNTKIENQYMDALKLATKRVEQMDSNRNYINLENGMLNLQTFRLENHQKELYSTIRIPYRYDEKADCPLFKEYLMDVLEEDEERITLISQILGYCLTAETKAQKAFLLFGKGGNGKSVLIDLLKSLCGNENVSAVPLKDLNNPFSRYDLVGKLVNLSTENELGSSEFNTEYFKSISSGDPIRVEKKYEPGFVYDPECKLVFAMNKLPFSKDKTYGFERRLIIVPFNKTYGDKGEKEADLGLSEKLKKELPGILNFALQGLKTLKENGYKFVQSKVVNQTVEEYTEKLNPIRTFFNEMIEPASLQERVKNETLRKSFADWCEDMGMNNNYSGITLLNTIRELLKDKKIPFELYKSGTIRGLRGIRLKEADTEWTEIDDMDEIDI